MLLDSALTSYGLVLSRSTHGLWGMNARAMQLFGAAGDVPRLDWPGTDIMAYNPPFYKWCIDLSTEKA